MKLYSVLGMAISFLSLSSPAISEQQFSFYGGVQSSPHSKVKGTEPNGVDFDFTAGWEGKSLSMPPYYGFRYTNWYDDSNGWSINFSHSKAYSDRKTRDSNNFNVLEFTDGLNPLTINWMHRYAPISGFRPYVGVGVGVAFPHVELKSPSMTEKTFEFQYGGPVVDFMGGATYSFNQKWSAFAEYAFHYVKLDVDMGDGGKFRTNLITNALNIGLNYSY